jgi:hypothetical protein
MSSFSLETPAAAVAVSPVGAAAAGPGQGTSGVEGTLAHAYFKSQILSRIIREE